MTEKARDLDQLARARAHELWVAEGRQKGREDEYWHRARELVDAEARPDYPPTQSRGYRT